MANFPQNKVPVTVEIDKTASNKSPLTLSEPSSTLFGWQIGANSWAWLGSLLLALLYGRVVLFNLGQGVVGGDIDGYENLWNFYWLRHALFNLHTNPFYTNYLYYPTGVSLRFHTLNPLNGLLIMPLWALFGSVAAINLFFLLSLTLNCFCAYLLLKSLTHSPLAAFAGAAVFTFADDQMLGFYSAGQTNLLAQWWLPLYVLCILRLVEHVGFTLRSWLWGGGAVGCLVAMALTDWQYVLYAVLVTILYAFFRLGWYWKRGGWQDFLKLTGVGVVWSVLVLVPLVLPMLAEAAANPYLISSDQASDHSRALFDFISLGIGQPGFLALGVILIGLTMWWRQHPDQTERAKIIFWLFLMLLFSLISLGPKLIMSIGTKPTNLPLLYALFQNLPILNIGRDPGRFYIVAMLAYSILLATALTELKPLLIASEPRAKRIFRSLSKNVLGLIEGLVVGVLLAVTLAGFINVSGQAEANPPDWPPFYEQLAHDNEQYAIMELPLFTENGRGEDTYEAYQSIHGKPRLGGRLARDHKLTNPNNFVLQATLFRDFFWLAQPDRVSSYRSTKIPDFLATPDYREMGIPLLNFYKVRYIVLYLEALNQISPAARTNAEALVEQVLGPAARPVYQDSKVEAYRVPPAPLTSSQASSVFIDTGSSGWYSVERSEGHSYRWADTRHLQPAQLVAFNLDQHTQLVQFDFTVLNFKTARHLQVSLDGVVQNSLSLEPGAIQTIKLHLQLAPGMHNLMLSTTEPTQNANQKGDTRELSFCVYDVTLTALENGNILN